MNKKYHKYLHQAEALHSEFGVTPLTLTLIQHGFQLPLLKQYLKDWYLPVSVIDFQGEKINWYISADFFHGISHFVVNKIKEDRAFVAVILQKSKKHGVEIDQAIKKIDRALKRGLELRQAPGLFRSLIDSAKKLCAYGFIAVVSDLYYAKFSRELEMIIEQYKGQRSLTRPAKEYVGTLITPTTKNAQWHYKQSLFILATTIARRFRPTSLERFQAWLVKNPKIIKQLTRTAKHFFALNYGHRGPGLSARDVTNDILDLFKMGEIALHYRRFLKEHSTMRQLQKKYTRELRLSTQARYLFNVARQFIDVKAYRLEKLFSVYAALDALLKEIAKQKYVPMLDLKYLSQFELFHFLRRGTLPSPQELKQRKERMTYTAWQDQTAEIRLGKDIEPYLKTFVAKTKDNQIRFSVHGNVACPGKVSGTVRIVNTRQDIHKIHDGDILVATQTSPELLPAMKRAAAFVTDVGGITSHAAIVSREMNKPCVIGTKVATQVFKDGDTIEVDATTGIVKKV